MENANSVERSNSRERDQASYFYVVWPEETVTTISASGALDPTLCAQRPHSGGVVNRTLGRCEHRLPQQEHQQQEIDPSSVALSPPGGRLSEIEVGSFGSPLTSPILSIADASPLVAQSAAVQTTAQEVVERTNCTGYEQQETNKRQAIVSDVHQARGTHSRSSCESSSTSQPCSPKTPVTHTTSQVTVPTLLGGVQSGGGGGGVASKGSTLQGASNGSSSSDAGNSAERDGSNRRKRPRVPYYTLNGCLECEVKDAEIKTLRRRIQVMEEVVALLNQKITAIQQSSNGMLFSPVVMPPVVSQVMIPTTYAAPPTSSIKYTTGEGNQSITATPPHISSDNDDTSSDSASIAYAQSELCPAAEHRVELIAGSGVYVTLPRLEEARREAKNGTQLARKLMDAFWDRDTLARSSLSSKSKFQYQQLDPNVINTIEAYCLSFDSSTHSRDLHACMTDKCCQARSRRAAPFKTATTLPNGLQQNGVTHNGT